MVRRLVISFLLGIGAILLAVYFAYNRGYETATLICEKQTNELIIQHETEKNQILSQIREKSPVERRKELSRYVIK